MTLKKWSVSFEDFSQSWFLCLHPCVHVHHQLVPRIGHGRKCLHTVEHLGWNLIRKRNLVKDSGLEPFWNPTRVESCAPPSSPSACSHWYRELAWHIAMHCHLVIIDHMRRLGLTWSNCHHPGCQRWGGRPWACGRRGRWRCGPCGCSSAPAACSGSCPSRAGTPTSSGSSPPLYFGPAPDQTSLWVSRNVSKWHKMFIWGKTQHLSGTTCANWIKCFFSLNEQIWISRVH